MAKFCTSCGHELREGDKFCAECGKPVGGREAQTQPARRGHWEYRTVAEDLDGTMFKGISWPMNGGVASSKSGDIADYIEWVVNELVARLAAEGWEPDESISADDLWRAQHVKWQNKPIPILGDDRVKLESVSVRFKRWVAQ